MVTAAGLQTLSALQRRGPLLGAELARELGVTPVAVHHRLLRLEREGLVKRRPSGPHAILNEVTAAGQQRLHEPPTRPPAVRELVAQLARREPNLSRRSMAKRLGVSVTTVRYHLSRLAGKVEALPGDEEGEAGADDPRVEADEADRQADDANVAE